MWKQGVSLDKTEPGICEKAPGRVKKQNRAEKLAQNENRHFEMASIHLGFSFGRAVNEAD